MSILVADDSSVSRELLAKTLRKWGFDVFTANNGLEALEVYKNNRINIVITDWVMPNMDGLTLCEEIRKFIKNSYTYIIIITAKDQSSDIKEALDKGADEYITKPIDMERLRVSLKTARRIISLSENLNLEIDKNKLLLENMKEGLLRVDHEGILTFVNDSLCQMLGYTREELIGKKILSIHEKEDNEIAERKLNRRREGIGDSYELNYITKEGGVIPTLVSAKPIFNSSGQHDGTVVVITDISKIKQAEQERKLIEAQLRQSDKMASIGQLAAGVAHEINNPTGFVSSNLNTLSTYIKDYNIIIDRYEALVKQLENSGKSDDFADFLQEIKEQEDNMDIGFLKDDISQLIHESLEGTERIKKIVQDLKDFAHPGDDKPKYADINRCIDSTLNIVWNEIKYKAQVKKEYGDLPEVLCFPQQLNQVFANILVNAAQAITEQGEISIRTSLSDENIEITISDTGCGIPKESLTKIFDPFFTTKDVGKGTGLGLNVAYNIVKKHNGKISVESEVGCGTTFTILVPVNNTDESLSASTSGKDSV
ncbi:MAG: response regulator [Deltaproteobacteria bacterium]|nr:response regulator [Deltaproteobacteria bacterium]